MSRDDEGTTATVEPEVTPETTPDTSTTNTPEATPATTPDATQATEPALTPEQQAEKDAADAAALQALVDAFEAAAKTAVDSADPTTAALTEEQVTAVKTAYGALPAGSPRTHAKKFLNTRMREEIGNAHVVQAKAYMTLEDAVKSQAAPAAVVRPPVDPTEDHVNRAAALFISANFLLPGPNVAADWSQRTSKLAGSLAGEVATYRDYLVAQAAWEADTRPTEAPEGTPEGTTVDLKGPAPTEPEVSEVVRTAAKIAQGRVAAPRKARAEKGATATGTPKVRAPHSGERRDIKAHILEVFAQKSVGTFLKYGDIAKAATSVAPNGDTSSGAVSARIKSPRWDVPSLVHAEVNGVQGVSKTA